MATYLPVIAIESVAKKYNANPSDIAARLERYGLINDRLWKH